MYDIELKLANAASFTFLLGGDYHRTKKARFIDGPNRSVGLRETFKSVIPAF